MLESRSLGLHRKGLLLPFCILTSALAFGQATAFSYQGHLTDSGTPASGIYDLQFKLFDALTGGVQQGGTQLLNDVQITGGIFTVTLDFGATVFPGSNRWLEVGVRPGVSTGAFTALSPLQPIAATPYAIRTLSATAADSLSSACVGCVNTANIAAGGIGTTQLADNAVTAAKIGTGAVGTTQIADGSITNVDISGAIAPSKITGTAATLGANTFTGAQNVTGSVTATSFSGSGAGLTNLPSGPMVFMAGLINPANITPFWTTLNGDSPQTTNGPESGATMPVSCTANLLYVSLYGVSGTNAGTMITVTLYKNRSATAMTCSASNVTGAATTCTSTQPVSVSAGDMVSLGYTQTSGTPIVRIGVGTRCQ